jgi:hypothetical protein
MHKQAILTVLTAIAFADSAFGQAPRDPMRVPEPQFRSSSICGVTSLFGARGVLFAPEGGDGGGGSGGGDEKKFSQADLDKIVTDRVKGLKDKIATLEAGAAEVAEIKKQLAKADEEREAAKAEAELKGKTELEKLQIQLQTATKKAETANSEWQKRLDEANGSASKAVASHRDYVQRHLVTTALNDAGIAKGAGKAATLAFLSEAQLELDDNLEIKGVAVGGKSFPKLGEAAKQFLADNPYFAPAAGGGSNSPRNGMNGGGGNPNVDSIGSLGSLLSTGLSQQAAKSA